VRTGGFQGENLDSGHSRILDGLITLSNFEYVIDCDAMR
jgi:hypothetical protein